MKNKHLIVIGGVAAGIKAAARARRVDSSVQITVFERGTDISVSTCGTPYLMSGLVTDRSALVIRKASDFLKDRVEVNTQHHVMAINSHEQTVQVLNLVHQTQQAYSFDSLIIATGAKGINPKISGNDLDGVFHFRNLNDSDQIMRFLTSEKECARVVIIGSGYIGLELAENLSQLSLDVILIEQSPSIFPKLDPLFSKGILEQLALQNVAVLLNARVSEILGENGKVSGIELESGVQVNSDIVIFACGIQPNVDLAITSGVELGSTGAIEVNEKLQTNIANIFAAGDCTESVHRVSKSPTWEPLGDIANLQGRIAGENAVGGHAEFHGVLGTSIFRCFDLEVAMTGLSEIEILNENIKYHSVLIQGMDRSRYFPGMNEVSLKLFAEQSSGRILGAQIIGHGGVAKLVDVCATSLLGEMTCFDLEQADFAYAPPFSPVLSPVIIASAELSKKVKSKN